MTEVTIGTSASSLIPFRKDEIVNITKDGKPVTTSLLIAEKFEKRHDNIIRDIENLECPDEFSLLNFEERDYENRGQKYPMFLITRDGFTLLAMGFTGKKAMEWKLKYIAAFNEMEKSLSARHNPILPVLFDKIDLLEEKIDQFRINSNVYGPVWSFAHAYCDMDMHHVSAKDDLYAVYVEHCQKLNVHTECKAHFFMKLYHAVQSVYPSAIMMHGARVRVVRGLGLKHNYKDLLQKNRKRGPYAR